MNETMMISVGTQPTHRSTNAQIGIVIISHPPTSDDLAINCGDRALWEFFGIGSVIN